MAESDLHRRMKAIVRRELELEDYSIREEPLFPPTRRMSWTAYRPDLLGRRTDMDSEEFVVAECETHPNMRRFRSKNFSSMRFQPSLFQAGSIRRVLAIPAGTLQAVDLRLRSQWEVWVLGTRAPVLKAGLLEGSPLAVGQADAPRVTDRAALALTTPHADPRMKARGEANKQ